MSMGFCCFSAPFIALCQHATDRGVRVQLLLNSRYSADLCVNARDCGISCQQMLKYAPKVELYLTYHKSVEAKNPFVQLENSPSEYVTRSRSTSRVRSDSFSSSRDRSDSSCSGYQIDYVDVNFDVEENNLKEQYCPFGSIPTLSLTKHLSDASFPSSPYDSNTKNDGQCLGSTEDIPSFVHAKYCVADTSFATIGSWNNWPRAAFYEHECNIFVFAPGLAKRLEKKFEAAKYMNCVRVKDPVLLEPGGLFTPMGCYICQPFGACLYTDVLIEDVIKELY